MWEQNPTKKNIRKKYSHFFGSKTPPKKYKKQYVLIIFWEQNPAKKKYKKNYVLRFFLGAKYHKKVLYFFWSKVPPKKSKKMVAWLTLGPQALKLFCACGGQTVTL